MKNKRVLQPEVCQSKGHGASISFFVKLRLLFEHGLYSRADFIHFFSHCSGFVHPLQCIRICLKLREVFEIEIFSFLKIFVVVAMAETGKRKCKKCGGQLLHYCS